jgi:hypothetical protein
MAVPSPRDYMPFYDSIKHITYVDILLVKYMEVVSAMQAIKEYFFDHDYDYLIICQDDYRVPQLAPYKIMLDAEYGHFDVVCGWCQIGADPNISNIGRVPIYTYINSMDNHIQDFQQHLFRVDDILKLTVEDQRYLDVTFTGHTLCAISRDTVKKWSPRAWFFHENANDRHFLHYNGVVGCWAGIDTWFSYEMMSKNVPIMADLSVFVKHDAQNYDNLLVGKREPMTEFHEATY